MSKIHYRDSIMNYVWKRPYSRELFTICGREIYDRTTDNPDEVTCKNCRRAMVKQEEAIAKKHGRETSRT